MTSPDAVPILRFQDVQARYGDADPLFEPLDLAVTPGRITALRGRSGAGKSTALTIAMGLRRPDAGTVLWEEQDLYRLDDGARTRLRRDHYGIMLQDGGLLHGLTALENVLIPVLRTRATKDDRARALAALDRVGLGRRADHAPDRLSGGEAQRVALARALFADAALLIIDEPTASLDRHNADVVIDLIAALADDGRGILVASHDPGVIAAAHDIRDIEPGS